MKQPDVTKHLIQSREEFTEMAKVAIWNTVAGKGSGDGLVDESLVHNQLGFLAEEAEELYGAFRNRKHHALLDAIGDVLVVAAGVHHLIGATSFPELPSKGESDEPIEEIIDSLYFLTKEVAEQPERVSPASVANAAISYACSVAHFYGYNPEEILAIVNRSNFTKFDESANEARTSVRAYKMKTRYTHVHSKRVGNIWVIYGNDKVNGTENKILKSVRFREPCFLALIERVNPQFMEA